MSHLPSQAIGFGVVIVTLLVKSQKPIHQPKEVGSALK
jgi:hypothetical protein